jgi:hypothetical protein
MEKHLRSSASMESTHAELEAFVVEEGREYQRRLLQAHLELRAERERPVEVQGADGVPRRHRRLSSRALLSVVGEVEVPRVAYQAPGAPGLHPMDAALNLPDELYSHSVRRVVAENAARSSFDEVVETLLKSTGAAVPKRQVEQLAARAAQDFDAFYSTRAVDVEDTQALLVLSFDGKGIAMRREDLRPATRKAAEAETHKLKKRLAKGEKRNRKRMAQVATLYTLDPWVRTPDDIVNDIRPVRDVAAQRPRPVNKRVWASVEKSSKEVIFEAFAEGLRRDPGRLRRWVVLVDGNKDQLSLVKRAAKKARVEITIVLDIIHVLEYLWKAAHCFFADGTKEAEQWVTCRLHELLAGRTAGALASTIRRHAASRVLDMASSVTLDTCIGYLVKHRTLLRYDRALAEGLPIATGVIEGACRHLVKDRMDRTGARWSLQGAEAVLRLRSLRSSGDFDAYWEFHLQQEHDRTHRARYAGGDVPSPLPAARPKLRRVK